MSSQHKERTPREILATGAAWITESELERLVEQYEDLESRYALEKRLPSDQVKIEAYEAARGLVKREGRSRAELVLRMERLEEQLEITDKQRLKWERLAMDRGFALEGTQEQLEAEQYELDIARRVNVDLSEQLTDLRDTLDEFLEEFDEAEGYPPKYDLIRAALPTESNPASSPSTVRRPLDKREEPAEWYQHADSDPASSRHDYGDDAPNEGWAFRAEKPRSRREEDDPASVPKERQ